MKGIHCRPHFLQIAVLLFSSFYLMASAAQFVYEAMVHCRYNANDHDDAADTDHEYAILCVGNSITAGLYGVTSVLTFLGVMYAIIFNAEADLLIAFVIFGIMMSYTCDVITNLRVNCKAGDTTEQNLFDDDSFDSAKSKCQTYTYGTISGCFGMIGAFISGYYGVLMNLNNGRFYIQRPIGLFVALCGYALVYSFNNLASAYVYCHYYDNGEDKLPVPAPAPPVLDDIVNGQLHPLCDGYTKTAIGYGVNGFVALLGLPVMFRFHKRGMWIILGIFLALCSSSNYSTFTGVANSYCDMKDNLLADMGQYSSYDMKVYENGCKWYSHAQTVSITATTVSSTAALISIADTLTHFDHDTLVIRFRRALFFTFALCFSLANVCVLHATVTADCDLYHDQLADDAVASDTDDKVERIQCEGTMAQIIFYYLSLGACVCGVLMSLVFNFPEKVCTLSSVCPAYSVLCVLII
jgi:hypothetical protein